MSRRIARLGRTLRNGLARNEKPAARLASTAGYAPADQASMDHTSMDHTLEQLEARQLLFTLSIGSGDVNPATGLGTKTALFTYFVPFLVAPVPPVATATPILENFDDEMGNWVNRVPPVPPNGLRFDMSRIQISYSTASTAAVQAITRVGANVTDRALRVALFSTDNLTFTFFDPQNQMANAAPELVRAANIVLSRNSGGLPSDNGDLNTDPNTGTRIELLNNGVVVQTLTGAQLDNIRSAFVQPPFGLQNTFQYAIAFAAGFDSIRFSSAANAPANATYSDNFVIEAINSEIPPNPLGAFVTGQLRDVQLTFTGPAGATAQLFDLYDRDMQLRFVQRMSGDLGSNPFDRNRDGVPEFNDGFGRVVIAGTDARSSITIVGGNVDGMGVFQLPAGPAEFTNNLNQTNFGFELAGTPPIVRGLPPVGASFPLGSPFVRDNTSPNAYFATAGTFDFNRANQGLFVNSASLGSALISGAVFGSGRVDGAINRYSVGYQAGSLRVDGDLGSFVSQTDVGGWSQTAGASFVFVPTGARLTFGRTVREIDIAARNLATISVLADVNNPNRARLVQRDYFTREAVYGFEVPQDGPRATVRRTINAGPDWSGNLGGNGQAIPFGTGYYRNDTIGSAEFVGYNGTSVRIFGAANGLDPVNTGFDSADVYAFPADSTREVVIAAPLVLLDYVRVVDRDGRVVAGLDLGERGRGPTGTNTFSSVLRFTPDHADVYYLVVNSNVTQSVQTEGQYQITVSGMAPVTLGAFRTGSGAVSTANPYVFTLASGDAGSIRIGTGYWTSPGGTSDTTDIAVGLAASAGVLDQPFRRYLGWGPSTISVPGNLYNMTVGGSVSGSFLNAAQLLVRGNLGTLVTGTFVRNIFNGDLYNADIRVGGSIALLDIKGGMAVEQFADPAQDARNGTVTIQTGTVPGQRGDIGRILIGAYMHGSLPGGATGVTIRTSAGSQIDQIIVGSNNDGAGSEFPAAIVDGAPNISVGDGSDVRFVSYSNLIIGNLNSAVRVFFGGSYQVVDDAGATVTISVNGGPVPVDPTMDPRIGSFIDINILRINGSRGFAIARIDATLFGGASLLISGNTPGIVTIGRIEVLNALSTAAGGTAPATPAPNPTIDISGTTEIDVGRINQLLGTLDAITNSTPNGDIVAIDALRLRSISLSGHLGRTQLSSASQALIGPFLGITGQTSAVLGPIVLNPLSINVAGGVGSNNWFVPGPIFTPVTNPGFASTTFPQVSYLEDVGSPIDPYLNGVIVRTGDLEDVVVNGTVGDVFVQTGHLINLVANADGITPQGGFQGIEGNIYAVAVGTVDTGDGLRGSGPSPFAQASIVADTSIVRVIFGGGRIQNSVDQGIIMAANIAALTQLGTTIPTPTQLPVPLTGIGRIEATNARYDTAFFYVGALDDFWLGQRIADGGILTGNIDTISGVATDLFRSDIAALNVAAITLTGGAYDATVTRASTSIGSIIADEFRNTTRLGTPAEAYPNLISAGQDMTTLQTNGLAGDISDLRVELGGSLLGQAAARNIQRSNFGVVNITTNVRAINDIRSVSIESGRLVSLSAGANIRSTSLLIAGPVESVTAADEITQLFLNSSGPDGRVDLVRAQNVLNVDINSSGNIGNISSVTNDVSGRIITRNDDVRANNGGLATLTAGRDLLVELSILGDTGTILAARNIGGINLINPDLDLRGNLANITAQTGQIYSDLLVGQSITGTFTTGRVDMRPGFDKVATSDILVFGAINALVLNSDFNGNITSRSGGIATITFNRASFRPGHAITVNNGNLGQLTFVGGDLLGNVLVDGDIGGIDALVDTFGFKGQIGIASWRRNFRPAQGDALRNELPPDVIRTPGVDGVTIKAGGAIDHVFVERGSLTESQIIAGTTIRSVNVVLQTRNDSLTTGLNNAIVAGDRIESVVLGGFTGAVAVLAGIIDLGADGRVGGTGNNADTVKSGSIGSVNFNGRRVVNSVVGAGIAPSASGAYNTTSSFFAAGRSSVDNVFAAGAIVGVSAYAAGSLGSTTSGIVRGGVLPASDPATVASNTTGTEVELANGVSLPFQLPSGERGRATLVGPGRAFYDPATGRIRLANTTTASTLTIVPNGTFLTSLTVLGNASSALGTLSIGGTLRGNSSAFINGDVTTMTFGTIDALGGLFGSGGNVASITTGGLLAGTLRGRVVGSLTVNGDLGRSSVENDAFVDFLNVTTVSITGAVSGAFSSDRGIPTLTAGSFNNGGVRSGLSIGTVTTGTMLGGRISARTSIGGVVVNGNATESQILGGADLGHDANFGGTGRDADVVGSGSINTLTVNGNFIKSDVGAGVLRGPSGFLGSSDVVAAAGRSSIGTITITGTQVGSTLNSQQYRILSTGTIGTVTVGGSPFTGTANFKVDRIAAVAVPVRVLDLFVTEASRIFTASIVFNQSIDISTLSGALSVLELRNSGATTIGLAEGTDYALEYDKAKNTVKVIFSRTVTERGLPQTPGIPGPGVYQFILNAAILRGSTQDSILDGNANGQPGDDFARNVVVGDAGDKITAGRPTTDTNISFYPPADLDLVLHTNAGVGSLPDTNKFFTVRGSIGDHPNTDPNTFALGGDVDVYRITLRAGQVIRMGQMSGTALGAVRGIFSSTGVNLASNSVRGPTGGAPGTAAVRLPNNISLDANTTSEDQYLISQTGTYYIVIAGTLTGVDIADTNTIANNDPVAGAFGLYSFSLEVFDDGNTGFVGDTASGTAAALVNPPTPIVFAGIDGIFGNADDLATFTQGDWVFTLTAGARGPNTTGAIVRGTNSQGWTITRSAAPNGTFGSANDRIFTSINSSIGLPGATGVPDEVSPDVDVFSINNGQPIAAGTKIRATFRLTKTGSNIGLSPEATTNRTTRALGATAGGQDLLGQAQFALFETPAGTGFGNGRLVASTSKFLPIGGQPTKTNTDGRNSYGYDANGDFFMEFIVPGAQGVSAGVPAAYSLYVQGAIRSDYTLEIVQQGTGSVVTTSQNVLLETQGGLIDWLEAGDKLTTQLNAFSSAVIGFTGQINGQSVDSYILSNVLSSLNALFTAANVSINFSTNPNDFAHQDFSTVILAGNVEPSAFFNNQTFGASQKVDFFNVDKNDQAVVFVSSLADLGFEPSVAGIDRFVNALSGAVARRVGELVGVRFETSITSAATPIPIMAADSVARAATGGYAFTTTPRTLAGLSDNAAHTVFYLGSQSSASLIQRVVLNRA